MTSVNSTALPLVSVVIPAFNAANTLAETLDSILAQTYPNLEIVVVNDGSTDLTASVLDRYGSKVRAITQPNRGLANARNTGCESAHGDYIALMDADDLCFPERIALQVAAMQKYPEAVLCSSDFSAFSAQGAVAASYGSKYYSMIENAVNGIRTFYPDVSRLDIAVPGQAGREGITVYHGQVYAELMHGNFVHPPTVMFRRGVIKQVGGFDESLRYTCDWEWFVRTARTGTFLYLSHPLLNYRLSAAQMSSQSRNGESAFDIVRAGRKIWRNDPAMAGQQRDRMRATMGLFCLEAADAMAEKQKLVAAKTLLHSIFTYGTLKPMSSRVGLKILMPEWMLQQVRRLRMQNANMSLLPFVPEYMDESVIYLYDCMSPLIPFSKYLA